MVFEDDVLNYLYEKAPNGAPTELKQFLREKIQVQHPKDDAWKSWSMPWAIAILNSLHSQNLIYFLNKDQIKMDDYHSRPKETQLDILSKVSVKAQLTDKGRDVVREGKKYKFTVVSLRTAVANATLALAISILILGINIKSCRREDAKEIRESNKLRIDTTRTALQEKHMTEIENSLISRIQRVEDSLKIAH